MTKTNTRLSYLLLIIFYIIAVFTRFYWMEHKAALHQDEQFSVVAANYNVQAMANNFGFHDNSFHTGAEIKQVTMCDDPTARGVYTDIKWMYGGNGDSPHTNLYYSLLRIALIGLETGDYKEVVFRGTLLNLFFFTISYIFCFLLMNLIFSNKHTSLVNTGSTSVLPSGDWLALVAVFCTFMSPALISNTIFLRPYQIQTTCFIVLAYFIVKALMNQKPKIIHSDNKSFININFKLLLSTALLIGITLLTGYYSGLYVFLLGLLMVFINHFTNKSVLSNDFHSTSAVAKGSIRCIFKSQSESLIFYCIAVALGFLIAQAMYSHYLFGYIGYRAYGTLITVKYLGFFNNLYVSLITPLKILYKNYFTPYVLGVIVLIVIVSSKNIFYWIRNFRSKTSISQENISGTVISALGFFVVAVLFIFAILYIAPYKVLRYVLPVFPVLILLPVLLLKFVTKVWGKIVLALLLMLAFTVSAYDIRNMEYLYTNESGDFKFTKDTDIPVLIINTRPNWGYLNMISLLNDKQQYIFADSAKDIEDTDLLKDYSEFYVVVCMRYNERDKSDYASIANSKFKITEEYHAWYNVDINDYCFKCFRVTSKG